jgi:hypothetical protein
MGKLQFDGVSENAMPLKMINLKRAMHTRMTFWLEVGRIKDLVPFDRLSTTLEENYCDLLRRIYHDHHSCDALVTHSAKEAWLSSS